MLAVIDEYLQARVMTANPHGLHLMVVDEARKAARALVQSLETDDLDAAHTAAGRARQFVGELVSGLRTDQSPELITQVQEYFLHIQKNLHLADLTQDTAAAALALKLIEEYRETWAALATSASTEGTSSLDSSA